MEGLWQQEDTWYCLLQDTHYTRVAKYRGNAQRQRLVDLLGPGAVTL